MRRCFFLVLGLCLAWLGLAYAQNPKIIYLRLLTPLDQQRDFYVGEKIALRYSLLLFSGASLADVEFISSPDPKLTQGVEILNPTSNWIKKEDDSYENVFYYKIKAENFALPSLKVVAVSADGAWVDSDMVKGKSFEAVPLGGEGYSGVVSEDLRVLSLRAKKYDEWNNIVIFDLQSHGGNLEDFKLEKFQKQGFNGEMKEDGVLMSGVYYCVIPSGIKELKFTYFNLSTLRYESKILPIQIQEDRVSTQTDLEPKNTFLIFSNLLFASLALCLFVAGFVLRARRRLSWILWSLAGLLLTLLFFGALAFRDVVLKPNATITILPTENSTPMHKIPVPVKVEVIGEHKGFYKIKFEDSKIGWVKKNDCQ